MASDTLTPFLGWFDRHFSIGLPLSRFVLNTLLLSVIGLMPVLVLYIVMVPGFGSHLMTADAALSGVIRQILTNGLPVVFLVNLFSLSLFTQLRADKLRPEWVLAADIAARIGAFIALHAIIYAASALVFGSFGGDPLQALRVVGPTLAQSATFSNLSGVYLYATLVSAFPLHMALTGAAMQRHGNQGGEIPKTGFVTLAFLALAVFGLQALLLTGVSLLLSMLL